VDFACKNAQRGWSSNGIEGSHLEHSDLLDFVCYLRAWNNYTRHQGIEELLSWMVAHQADVSAFMPKALFKGVQ
jgi:hypothetical protein